MTTRICRGVCKQEKDLSEFSSYKSKNGEVKYRYYCKNCDYLNVKEYRKNHLDKHREQTSRYYEKHKDERKEYHKQHYIDHIDERKQHYQENKEELLSKQKEYYKKNPDKKREHDRKYFETHKEQVMEKKKEYYKMKYLTDPIFRLRKLITRSVWGILNGKKEGKSWLKFVDYNLDELKLHLENQFKPGMTWSNYGIYWHLDHKVPINSFNITSMEDEAFKKCWSLKNLQPLYGPENISKNDTISEEWGNVELAKELLDDIEIEINIEELIEFIII